MRIKKVSQTTATNAQIVDGHSDSTEDGYSCNYINEVLRGNTLYENPQGISSGSFTINDDLSNYQRIKIFDYDGQCVAEYETSALYSNQLNFCKANQGSTNLYLSTGRLTREGRVLTFYSNKRTYYNGTTWVQDTNGIVYIAKVVGYKY